MSISDFLCSGQQMLRSVWRHYNQSTGGLHCKTVTVEMIDSRRHFKASLQPHKPRLDLNTMAPPRKKTQIPIRENRYGFTYKRLRLCLYGIDVLNNESISLHQHTSCFIALSAAHVHKHTSLPTHIPRLVFYK